MLSADVILAKEVLVSLSSLEGQPWHLFLFFSPVSTGCLVGMAAGWLADLSLTLSIMAAAAEDRAYLCPSSTPPLVEP